MTFDETSTENIPSDIRALVDERLGVSSWSCQPLEGDASIRQYSRVRGPAGETLIVTTYPEAVRSQLDRFISTYAALAGNVQVPDLLATCHSGVLQYDAGDAALTSVLRDDPDRGRELYRDAVDQLVSLQSCGSTELPNPPFDAAMFLAELEMTNEFYVQRLMDREEAASALRPLFRSLSESLTRHPYVLCHRDYHGENVLVQDDRLWIVDFQDMRMGPDTYDLASLLRDRGVVDLLGKEVEEQLLGYYARRAGTGDDVRKRYWETLLQRTIKIVGTFARQSVERGRHHYLDYIPPGLEAMEDCVGQLPQYRPLLDAFPMDFERLRGERT